MIKTEEIAQSAEASAQKIKDGVDRLKSNIQSVIYVQPERLEYIIAAMIAGGHVILADTHGVGKTSLARAIAGSIAWPSENRTIEDVDISWFSRIQCTVDLLPQDILGFTRIFGSDYNMVFNRGPIFSHFILCDEINLLTPKTQGSFFQAMEEGQVSIEGKTYSLPSLFFIIATMNLKGSHLFPLPAPQLDRFMIQISLGYPSVEDEQKIVLQHGSSTAWDNFAPVIDEADILSWISTVDRIRVHPDIIEYIVDIVRATRNTPHLELGASPRTGVKISRMARALAALRGMSYIDLDIVKEVLLPVMTHRVQCSNPQESPSEILEAIIRSTAVDPSYSRLVKGQPRP